MTKRQRMEVYQNCGSSRTNTKWDKPWNWSQKVRFKQRLQHVRETLRGNISNCVSWIYSGHTWQSQMTRTTINCKMSLCIATCVNLLNSILVTRETVAERHWAVWRDGVTETRYTGNFVWILTNRPNRMRFIGYDRRTSGQHARTMISANVSTLKPQKRFVTKARVRAFVCLAPHPSPIFWGQFSTHFDATGTSTLHQWKAEHPNRHVIGGSALWGVA